MLCSYTANERRVQLTLKETGRLDNLTERTSFIIHEPLHGSKTTFPSEKWPDDSSHMETESTLSRYRGSRRYIGLYAPTSGGS